MIEEKQQEMAERYLLIPDPQERLMAITGHICAVGFPKDEEQVETNLVQGCQSRVWVVAREQQGKLALALSSDSVLVQGLARFVADLYHGSDLQEAAAFQASLLEQVKITETLSPTRQNGIASLTSTIRRLAANL